MFLLTFTECQICLKQTLKGIYMNNKVGIIKEIDALGRIVIPKEFRERLKLDKSVDVVLTQDGVLIRNSKYELTKKKRCQQEKANGY